MKNHFQKLTISIKQPQTPVYEHLAFAAGFPPYVRGYTSAENLLQSACFKDFNFEINECTEQIVTEENTFLILNDAKMIPFEEVVALRLHQAKAILLNNLKIPKNVQLLYVFTNESILNIAQIRAIRMFWAKIMFDFNITEKLPICALVQNPIQKYFALTTGIHRLFYISQNESLFIENEFILLENTMLPKSVDPWAGSQIIEEATQNYYVKLEEKFAQMGQ